MYGKIIKLYNNDLYGNVDDRTVAVFAAFNHLKYMNRYVIFCFTDEYNNKKLCYGSVHVKDNSLVIFAINDNNMIQYINKFINDYLNNRLDGNEFQIFDLSNINRVELVSYSSMNFEYIAMLDNMSIKKEVVTNVEDNKSKKSSFGYVLILLLIIVGGGLTYLYFNPSIFDKKLKQLECTINGYDKKIATNYEGNIILKFDRKDKLDSFQKTITYKFEEETYNSFKENNREKELGKENDTYKYDDEKYELIINSNEKLVIQDYNEVYEYIKKMGYSCIEGTYDE